MRHQIQEGWSAKEDLAHASRSSFVAKKGCKMSVRLQQAFATQILNNARLQKMPRKITFFNRKPLNQQLANKS